MSEGYKFWMVWREGGNAPTKRHFTQMGACAEAKRLCALHPGQRFFVMQADGSFVIPCNDATWTPATQVHPRTNLDPHYGL